MKKLIFFLLFPLAGYCQDTLVLAQSDLDILFYQVANSKPSSCGIIKNDVWLCYNTGLILPNNVDWVNIDDRTALNRYGVVVMLISKYFELKEKDPGNLWNRLRLTREDIYKQYLDNNNNYGQTKAPKENQNSPKRPVRK